MPLNLSIKNVPNDFVERLRERAKRNHRSLQGELMAILEETLKPRELTVEALHQKVRDLGLTTRSEAEKMAREDRDAR